MAAAKRKAPPPQSSPEEEEVSSGEEEQQERVAAKPSPLKRNKSAHSSESEESSDEEEAEEEKEEERVSAKPSPLKRNMSAHSSESEESSDEEEAEEEKEEERVATKPSLLKRNKSAHSSESEESNDEEEAVKEEEEKENEPVSKPTEPEPSDAVESDDEEEEGEEGEEEEEKEDFVLKATDPVKKPESESAKKRMKFAASPSQSSGKFTRIWTYDDELALMQALSQFQSEQGRLPTQKEYGLVLNSLKRKLNPAIQEKQVINKIRALKDSHSAWKRRGTEPFSSSNPHAKALFEISIKLWGGNVEVPKKVEEPSQDVSHDEGLEIKTINGSTTISGEQNAKDGSKFPYLMDAIAELGKNDPGMLLFYKNSFEMVDKSMAGDFEAKFKKLKYNQAKLIFDKLELTNKLAKELTKLGK